MGRMYDSPSNTWPPQQEAVYLIMRESVRDTQGASSGEGRTKTTTDSFSRPLPNDTHTHTHVLSLFSYHKPHGGKGDNHIFCQTE